MKCLKDLTNNHTLFKIDLKVVYQKYTRNIILNLIINKMKEIIYNELKLRIINGEILPGSILTEREICNKYSISRTPVREVFWRLVSNGLLIKDPSREYLVAKLTLDKIFNIFQSREAIEGMAARIACSKCNRKFLNELNKLGETIKEIDIDRNAQEHVYYGRQLHDMIIDKANNPFLTEFYKKLTDLSALIRHITKNSPLIEKKSKEAHLKIINAFNEKDEEKSEYYMREHLSITCKLMGNYFYPSIFKQYNKV